ncbi:3-keto-disaccharide hydrolase [Oleiharenicola lentus]|uniref:3-keto-disaccharide hydrolase n=1 Tax=Oleiharenicola lentus TaxID=2508720 RepID=UPI003F6770B6
MIKRSCLLLLLTTSLFAGDAALNTLTPQEKAAGWKLLWDGHSSAGWRSAKGPAFPKGGWTMKDGLLTVEAATGKESGNGGDIITTEKYSAFEMTWDFRLTPGANSGVKYYVDPEINKGEGSAIGLEYQLLDDVLHPDAKLGRDGNRTLASLYDLITASKDKKPNAIGEWNSARLVSDGKNIEHWLNGKLVLSYTRGTPEFRALVAASKYKIWPNFGELPQGHILLQDHGNEVQFRNIKLRNLK